MMARGDQERKTVSGLHQEVEGEAAVVGGALGSQRPRIEAVPGGPITIIRGFLSQEKVRLSEEDLHLEARIAQNYRYGPLSS